MAKQTNTEIEVEVRSRAELRKWLGRNHGANSGIWLVHYKKSSSHYLPMADIVAECLAHGWVDSRTCRKDDLRSMHWIAPRKTGSNWSPTNKKLAAELMADGLMTGAGLAAIDAAKADGSWTRLDAAERLEVPPDMAKAFASRPGSKGNWDAFSKSVRRTNLEWILAAKRPETRARRINEIAEKAQAKERVSH